MIMFTKEEMKVLSNAPLTALILFKSDLPLLESILSRLIDEPSINLVDKTIENEFRLELSVLRDKISKMIMESTL